MNRSRAVTLTLACAIVALALGIAVATTRGDNGKHYDADATMACLRARGLEVYSHGELNLAAANEGNFRAGHGDLYVDLAFGEDEAEAERIVERLEAAGFDQRRQAIERKANVVYYVGRERLLSIEKSQIESCLRESKRT